jgi:monoamine oxidase
MRRGVTAASARPTGGQQARADSAGTIAGSRARELAANGLSTPLNGLTVTVVGAGFAGLMAACFLREAGFEVTVLEARPEVGGRVKSLTDLSAGRVIEAGAELIGANHPVWLSLATGLGLGLSVLTSDDQFAAASLEAPLYLKGRLLTAGEANDVYGQMSTALGLVSKDATLIEDPYRPWESPNAETWDATSVGAMLRSYGVDPDSLVWDALAVELGNNQAIDIDLQSYLGLTAVVRGGQLGDDINAFWTESEIYRCEAGNQELARRLRNLLDAASPGAVHTSTPVDTLTIAPDDVGVSAGALQMRSDYAVLAVPQPTWPEIAISPPIPATYLISTGPAVKYLSPLAERFWLRQNRAPAGMSDALGETWEGTDNQMAVGGQGIELSVFAGGSWAHAALAAHDKQ